MSLWFSVSEAKSRTNIQDEGTELWISVWSLQHTQRLTFSLAVAVRYYCGSFLQPFICCCLLLFAGESEEGNT